MSVDTKKELQIYILAKNNAIAKLYAEKVDIKKYHYVTSEHHILGLNSGKFICVEGYTEHRDFDKISREMSVLIHVYKVECEYVSL